MVPTETRKRKLRIFFTISSFPVTLFPEHTHLPPVIFFLKGATCMRLKKIKKDEMMNAMKRTPDPETATLVNFCYPSRNSLCVCVFISKILYVCLNSQVFTLIRKRVVEGVGKQESRPLSRSYPLCRKAHGHWLQALPRACTILGKVLLSLFLFYKKTKTVHVFVCISVCVYKLCFSNKNESLHLHYSFCF